MFVLALWFISKEGKFKGPKINMAELEERRMATLGKLTEGVEQVGTATETSMKGKDVAYSL
jgi:choline transport protein